MQKEKLWTKDFILISVINFVIMLSIYLLLVTMASYATEQYHTSPSTAGLVASIFILGALAGRLYGGNQISKKGNKKILIGGILLFVIFTTAYFIAVNIYILIAVRFLHGIGAGLATTGTSTIVSQIIPRSRSGEGIGYFSLSVVLATAIGPFIGLSLIKVFGYTSIFMFSLIVGLLGLFIAFPVKAPVVEGQSEAETRGGRLSNFIERRALPISFVMLVAGLAYSSILSFISSFAAEIDLAGAGSYYFLVYAIIILLSRPFTGKLMDVKGGNSVAYPALILFACGMFILSQAHSSFLLLLAAAIIGLGYGNFQSCTQALAIKMTPPHRMGLANSTYFIFMDLGLGIGPFFLGYLVPVIGFRGLYQSLIIVILAAVFVYYLLHGRKDKALLVSYQPISHSK